MLEATAHLVAPYQQIYELCKTNTSISNFSTESSHLAALMSHVYADLVQFSLDLYRIFCRETPSTYSFSHVSHFR